MDVVAAWTGRRADTLRQALRMTNETFAEHLGVAVRTVAYWRARPDVIPRPVMQEMLDVALARAPEQARAHSRCCSPSASTARHRRWPARGSRYLTTWPA